MQVKDSYTLELREVKRESDAKIAQMEASVADLMSQVSSNPPDGRCKCNTIVSRGVGFETVPHSILSCVGVPHVSSQPRPAAYPLSTEQVKLVSRSQNFHSVNNILCSTFSCLPPREPLPAASRPSAGERPTVHSARGAGARGRDSSNGEEPRSQLPQPFAPPAPSVCSGGGRGRQELAGSSAAETQAQVGAEQRRWAAQDSEWGEGSEDLYRMQQGALWTLGADGCWQEEGMLEDDDSDEKEKLDIEPQLGVLRSMGGSKRVLAAGGVLSPVRESPLESTPVREAVEKRLEVRFHDAKASRDFVATANRSICAPVPRNIQLEARRAHCHRTANARQVNVGVPGA